MKFLLTIAICTFSPFVIADSVYDLQMYLMEQELWRLTDQQVKQLQESRGRQNTVDTYMSTLYKENRKKASQLGAPKTNPIADPSSWARVANKKSTNPWFIHKPSIQRVSDNEYAYWSLIDTGPEPYKAIGFDVLIMSMASKEIINCSNRKYKYQAMIDFTGKHGTGEIIKINIWESLDSYKDEPVEIKEIVCPPSLINSIKKNIGL